MQEYAESFYKSKAWQDTRNAYMESVHGLCENCMRHGIYNPADIVHHKEHITQINITNPEVTLAWKNLEALCRKCHGLRHSSRKNKRCYHVDKDGTIFF